MTILGIIAMLLIVCLIGGGIFDILWVMGHSKTIFAMVIVLLFAVAFIVEKFY